MSAATARLVQAAIDAAKTAYAPYSNFHVGAALLLDNNEIVTGSNFENASYGMTLCAETVAISKANSDGQLHAIREIAVAGGLAGPCCQVISIGGPTLAGPNAAWPEGVCACACISPKTKPLAVTARTTAAAAVRPNRIFIRGIMFQTSLF